MKQDQLNYIQQFDQNSVKIQTNKYKSAIEALLIKEEMNFKLETEKKFQCSFVNQVYSFPRHFEELQSSQNDSLISQQSLDSLQDAGTYNLHSQNTKLDSKRKKSTDHNDMNKNAQNYNSNNLNNKSCNENNHATDENNQTNFLNEIKDIRIIKADIGKKKQQQQKQREDSISRVLKTEIQPDNDEQNSFLGQGNKNLEFNRLHTEGNEIIPPEEKSCVNDLKEAVQESLEGEQYENTQVENPSNQYEVTDSAMTKQQVQNSQTQNNMQANKLSSKTFVNGGTKNNTSTQLNSMSRNGNRIQEIKLKINNDKDKNGISYLECKQYPNRVIKQNKNQLFDNFEDQSTNQERLTRKYFFGNYLQQPNYQSQKGNRGYYDQAGNYRTFVQKIQNQKSKEKKLDTSYQRANNDNSNQEYLSNTSKNLDRSLPPQANQKLSTLSNLRQIQQRKQNQFQTTFHILRQKVKGQQFEQVDQGQSSNLLSHKMNYLKQDQAQIVKVNMFVEQKNRSFHSKVQNTFYKNDPNDKIKQQLQDTRFQQYQSFRRDKQRTPIKFGGEQIQSNKFANINIPRDPKVILKTESNMSNDKQYYQKSNKETENKQNDQKYYNEYTKMFANSYLQRDKPQQSPLEIRQNEKRNIDTNHSFNNMFSPTKDRQYQQQNHLVRKFN